ncbi:MAG: hypothetical protein QM791_16210 [Ferruginibacter sp.]
MKRVLFSLSFLATFITARSQDANYWSNHYGAGGFLMPGATIARNMDSGVLFYNPALLGYNTKNAASISGSIYNLQSTKIKNGAGTGLNLHSSSAGVIPVIASNTIYLNLKGKPFTIAYALLNNPVMRYHVTQRRDERLNVLRDDYSPGAENFIGQYSNTNSVDETSGILAFGKPVSSRMAVGVSFAVNIRQQNMLIDSRSRALINDTSALFEKLVTSSEYYLANNLNIGLAIKAGLSYDLAPKHHLGILLSAPLIHLYSKADILSDNVINNLSLVTGAADLFLLANTRQTRLKSKWKMPLSGAVGYTYDYGGGQLYFAAEYFSKVKEYNVITPRNEYFIRPDTGDNRLFTPGLLRMRDARKPIVNFALAASFLFKENVTGYCSIRTDFSYVDEKSYAANEFEGYKVNTANWNLYHLQFGANVKKRKFNLRSGILLSYGITNNYKQSVNYDNPNELNLLTGDAVMTKARRLSAGLMFSYIHNF